MTTKVVTASKLDKIKPKNLFLIDLSGALFSAFMLGVVLVHFHSFFGIPERVLYLLAAIPCVFALLDILFYLKPKMLPQSLKVMAILNFLYILISLFFAFSHAQEILIPGWIYIISEIAVIIILVFIELKIAGKIIS